VEATPTPSAAYRRALLDFNVISERGDGKFRISLLNLKDHLVLRLEGMVAQQSSLPLVDRVKPILAAHRTRSLIVDLSLCDQLNSAAIGLIAFCTMEMSRRQAKTYLVRPKPQIASMLKVLGADRTMTVVASIEEIPGT
jgi:anti-anti-sigma factor